MKAIPCKTNEDECKMSIPSPEVSLRSSPRLPDQIASILSERIGGGDYPPGGRLPPESRLAVMFGVSRSVVREALSQLKYEGFGPSGRRSFRLEAVGVLNREDLAQFYEMRAIIEAEAAALAACRRSIRDIRHLRSCLERMAQAVERRIDGTEPDLAFHRIIAGMSGNKYLKDLMDYLNGKAGLVIRTARDHSSRDAKLPAAVQKEHEDIFQALEAGDAARARAATLRHLKNAARRLGVKPLGYYSGK